MINAAEVRRSLIGAWRVFLGLPDAMRAFDTSIEGFWRSFQAILVVAPIYAVSSLADWRVAQSLAVPEAPLDGTAFVWEKAVTLALDWVTLPLLLAALAGFLGFRKTYTAFIVVRNWATILMILPFAAITVLDALGFLPGDIILFPSLIALGFAFRVQYMAARMALGVGMDIAIGIVVLDFLISLAIVRLIGRLFGIDG